MAKLADYDLHKLSNELEEFRAQLTLYWNFGKLPFQVVSSPPTFAGNAGEVVFYRSGTDGRMYVYMGSSWNLAVLFTADAS